MKTQEGRTATPSPTDGEAADAVDESAARPDDRNWLQRRRSPRRPRIWFEILLIGVSYWIYSLVRNAVPEQRVKALHNADWIWSTEHTLGIAVEEKINHAVNSVTWLIVGMNYYYATLHFIITVGVLVWLYRRHPGRYAAARLVLFATTGVALVGFYLYPLAPPRLMPGGNFIDTVTFHHTWGSMASGNLKSVSNQFAAMPSMHIGWSLWCGLTIFALAKRRWVRTLGLVYPAATLLVIVSTANHFWLDAVGGMICLAFGFAVSYVWYGKLPYHLPRVAVDDRNRASRRAAGVRERGTLQVARVVQGHGTAQRPARTPEATGTPGATVHERPPSGADVPGGTPQEAVPAERPRLTTTPPPRATRASPTAESEQDRTAARLAATRSGEAPHPGEALRRATWPHGGDRAE